MKKYLFAVLIALLLIPSVAMGAVTPGVCTQTPYSWVGGFVYIVLTCTGASDNGSIPNTDISAANMELIKGTHYLYTVSAYPTSGGTPPDVADVFILDANGEDLLGSADGGTTPGKGANLIHATLKKTAMPYSYHMSQVYPPPVINTLTLKVLNQATVSANYTIELLFVR